VGGDPAEQIAALGPFAPGSSHCLPPDTATVNWLWPDFSLVVPPTRCRSGTSPLAPPGRFSADWRSRARFQGVVLLSATGQRAVLQMVDAVLGMGSCARRPGALSTFLLLLNVLRRRQRVVPRAEIVSLRSRRPPPTIRNARPAGPFGGTGTASTPAPAGGRHRWQKRVVPLRRRWRLAVSKQRMDRRIKCGNSLEEGAQGRFGLLRAPWVG
jgi:hypothetical protein